MCSTDRRRRCFFGPALFVFRGVVLDYRRSGSRGNIIVVLHDIVGEQMVLLADYAPAIRSVYKESRTNKEKTTTMSERTELCKGSNTRIIMKRLNNTANQWSECRADP